MAQLPHTKVTRDEWVAAALGSLGEVAIDELRVLSLAERLSISRSSFYWYFDDLRGLQDELLTRWEGNTRSIVERTERQAPTITTACLGVFECWADGSLYDAGLDLAVEEVVVVLDHAALPLLGEGQQRLRLLVPDAERLLDLRDRQ